MKFGPFAVFSWLLLLLFVALSAVRNAHCAEITTFEAPDAIYTNPAAINQSGEIVGTYSLTGETTGAFIRDSEGKFTIVDSPRLGEGIYSATSINPAGAITGGFYCNYPQRSCDRKGFSYVRGPHGRFTEFPGDYYPLSINPAGAVAGIGKGMGFVREPSGTITTFDVPGAESYTTTPTSINPSGQITGYYYDPNSVWTGFVRFAGGRIAKFTAPGATLRQFEGTFPQSINPAGTITGYYWDSNELVHGFVRQANGKITTFDPPGSVNTEPASINPAGTITGYYTDANDGQAGFVRDSKGSITTFAINADTLVYPVSINASGVITGWYVFTADLPTIKFHGFIRTP